MSDLTLTEAELAVMELLWERDRMTARDIRELLYPDAERSQHGTVQKLLQRLEEKGYIRRDRSLPIHFFSAVTSRESYGARQLERLARRLTAGKIAPLITHLVEERRISAAEIRRLRAILDKSASEGCDGE